MVLIQVMPDMDMALIQVMPDMDMVLIQLMPDMDISCVYSTLAGSGGEFSHRHNLVPPPHTLEIEKNVQALRVL